jgi:hypothetical protein
VIPTIPRDADSVVSHQPRYDHLIDGEYVPPVKGQYSQRAGLLLMDPAARGAAGSGIERVALTPAAAALLVKLTEMHDR